MALMLYMDHHVRRAITTGLRLREVDVLTAFDDGASTFTDPELLDRAGVLNRVLFSQDDDLLVEAVRRQRGSTSFNGLIYAHQLRISVGQCIRDLELIAKVAAPEELNNQIIYLPL